MCASACLDFEQGHGIACTFETIIRVLMSNCDTAIGTVDAVSDRDKGLLRDWSQSKTLPIGLCLHEILERQALLTPKAEAVCSWDGALSYGDLDDASSRLGHYLVQEGRIEVEALVGFAFEKSLRAIITMIGSSTGLERYSILLIKYKPS